MSYILTTQCADDIGLIAKITGLCHRHNLNIIRNNEFVDKDAQRFFMRTELTGEPHTEFLAQLREVLPAGAKVALHGEEKTKVVLLATKEAHCLGGMLLKQFEQTLNIEILAVIANYPTLEPLVKGFDIPFHVVSHEGLTRSEHDEKVGDLIASYNSDIIGLAKYMRILSPEFVGRFEGKIINIHHSFLPAFIGAKPYHQAFERGVKIIGATAHFVNNELDEGPIILQDVSSVTHANTAEMMAKMGKDVEKTVFCKALQLASEHKLFINGNKTVVFS
ncbi:MULTISPECIES: formyltetrahydrofolate deformylase [Pseudoalteromonas]|jgi:formyltetrahydrofolate deformylase|uniref:formyltetrahydrofolate deformylase n=1 Tax=Pseudoalteromonas TaxID=53246 RepID=UPI000C6A5127|nr:MULTISPECIES: formyltetrahydrofolate deformylase [Pseudoalteromonas]MAY60303.1 formyltetrahydrofolate deformylase [Pseudoalteromonas sp.]MDN3404543.1 formyltetrahydrofolate deformylase [Pseudoalteromonas sp. APC 3218]MDN3409867.1 formyltetrahydrofolate deformylase [Pseudoalteromonas sp. APC 3894]MDN3415016.1 formyltetrahydrofolate deformylase [Pseudoalteromonas sp. APC 3227]MDN3418714.1 formyltetrahydrofolate deformylase [Pseudoalteromonas sp. APC 3895]|tara:strand:- start:10096 stop:10926 length:831 start_codon:yes stop_codon:yes gene_type:complete